MGWKGASIGYFLSLIAIGLCDPYEFSDCFQAENGDRENVFGFSASKVEDEHMTEFTEFQGKVMVIVNVASF